MKYILAIMCGLVVLFMGGCGLILLPAAGPLVLLPAAAVFLNLAIIGALFGWKVQWLPAFYILGVIDFGIAILCTIGALLGIGINDPSLPALFWTIGGLFGLKGMLSFLYARNSKQPEI